VVEKPGPLISVQVILSTYFESYITIRKVETLMLHWHLLICRGKMLLWHPLFVSDVVNRKAKSQDVV